MNLFCRDGWEPHGNLIQDLGQYTQALTRTVWREVYLNDNKEINKMYTNPEMIPADKTVWLVFDLSNGNPDSRRYVWWFDTEDAAREHISWQSRMEYAAYLSEPMEFIRAGADNV